MQILLHAFYTQIIQGCYIPLAASGVPLVVSCEADVYELSLANCVIASGAV